MDKAYIEEAAKEYVKSLDLEKEYADLAEEHIMQDFIAGARWATYVVEQMIEAKKTSLKN